MTTNSPARYTVRFPTSSIIIFASCHILLTAITSKNDTAGIWLDISDKASGRGLNMKGMDILLSALISLEIIQF